MPTLKYKDPVTGEYKSDIHVVGAVSSVNGKTGVVELTNSDIPNAITDVQVNGTSVVTDGVANVPVATIATGKHGVVAVSSTGGIAETNGSLYLYNNTGWISDRYRYGAITNSNLDYAVKSAMCDGKGAAWTAVEQAAARTRMDAASQLDVDKLKAAAEGHLYMFQQDSAEAYEKSVPSDAMQWATLDKVGGKTLVWNQMLYQYQKLPYVGFGGGWSNRSSDQAYNSETHEYTMIATKTSDAYNFDLRIGGFDGLFDPTHVYAISASAKITEHGAEYPDTFSWFGGDGTHKLKERSLTSAYTRLVYVGVWGNPTVPRIDFASRAMRYDPFTVMITDVLAFDLTAMFGSGNEPTAEQFEAMFPADYYPHSEPTLMTYSPESVVNSTGDTKDLSALVQKYFPNGMKSAGDAHDEIDLEHGIAVQRIGSVDLGTQTWSLSPEGHFRTGLSQRLWGRDIIRLICDRLVTASATGSLALSDNMITSSNTSSNIYAKDSSCDTADAFGLKMSGATLYFELAAPIETPIDPADLADLAFLNVEAGGSLTFANDQGDAYHVTLPNSETWMIKLPGVTA